MRYYTAKMKAARKEETYQIYTADSLRFILQRLGAEIPRCSELLHPQPEDSRTPEEIAMERAANMGLKVVQS